jgi:hypothetical protein
MPVSKKRKKDGKPVQRQGPASGDAEAHADHPEGHPAHGPQRAGKPKNPFVAQKSQVRGAQRGR